MEAVAETPLREMWKYPGFTDTNRERTQSPFLTVDDQEGVAVKDTISVHEVDEDIFDGE
jgi:hypothetical protein